MARGEKIHVCYDPAADAGSFDLLASWRDDGLAVRLRTSHELNDLVAPDSPHVNRRLVRERLSGADILLVLIGDDPEALARYVRWEVEFAVQKGIPIIALYLDGARRLDPKLCPPALKEELALHAAFEREVLEFALIDWPELHASLRDEGETGDYYYRNHVYRKLGF